MDTNKCRRGAVMELWLMGTLMLCAVAAALCCKLSPYVSFTVVPLAVLILCGGVPTQVFSLAVSGVKSVFSITAQLLFTIVYFTALKTKGFFAYLLNPVIRLLRRGSAVLPLLAALLPFLIMISGSVTTTYLVSISFLLPLWEAADYPKPMLNVLIAAGTGIGLAFPWNSKLLLLSSIAGVDARELWLNALPLQGIALGLAVALCIGTMLRHRPKEAAVPPAPVARPEGFALDAALLLLCFALLFTGVMPVLLVYMVAAGVMLLRCRGREKEIFSNAAAAAIPAACTAACIGCYIGCLKDSGILADMIRQLSLLLPQWLLDQLPILLSALCCILLIFVPFQAVYALMPILCGLTGNGALSALLPFAILYPTTYAPTAATAALFDTMMDNPPMTHLQRTALPIGALHIGLLLLGRLCGLF